MRAAVPHALTAVRWRTVAGFALAAAGLAGCAGFREAVRDGVAAEFGGRPVTVRLRTCDRLRSAPPPVATHGRVGLVRVADGGSRVVGERYKAGGGRTTEIVLDGDPGSVLSADVRSLLGRQGVAVADDEPRVRVETAMAGLTSWTRGGVTQVTTGASASILVRLRVDGRMVWSRFFDGRHEATMTAVLTSDVENAVNEAYCRSLEALERLVATPEFQRTAGHPAD